MNTSDQIAIFDSNNLPGSEVLKRLLGDVTIIQVMKWMLLGGLGMYVMFAIVIIKQVSVMTETVEDDANGVIKIFAWAHLLMALILVVMSAVWL